MSDSTITAMPPAALPLVNEAVPCVQDGMNVQAPAAAFGIPIASPSAPMPLSQFQTWIDESTAPPTLRMYIGASWVALYTLATDGTLALAMPLTLPADPSQDGQAATKHYVDHRPGAPGTLTFKHVLDCDVDPNYPTANQGDFYVVGLPGKIGGAGGPDVETGDSLLCLVDGTTSGDQGGAGANWTIGQGNIGNAVSGPASAVGGNFALFDGTSGKLIKDGLLALDTDATMAANSDARIPSQKAVKAQIGGQLLSTDTLGQGQTWLWDAITSAFRTRDIDGQNLLVNSAFDIWQENTAYTLSTSAAQTHVADFWKAGALGAGGRTVTRVTGISGSQYAMKFQRVPASTAAGAFLLVQQFDTAESLFLSGRTVTVSFDFVAGADYQSSIGLYLTVFGGTGTAQSPNLGLSPPTNPTGFLTGRVSFVSADLSPQIAAPGTVTRIYGSTTIGSGLSELAFAIQTGTYPTISGGAHADDSFTIANIKLEIGNVATPYVKPDAADELRRCQTRYSKTFLQATVPTDGPGTAKGEHRAAAIVSGANVQTLGTLRFPVMRTPPAVTLFNPEPGGAAGQARDLMAGADCTSTAAQNIAESSCEIVTTANASTAAGNTLGVHAVMDARL